MKWNRAQLKNIHLRTQGRCHICSKRVALRNHGKVGRRGAWHVDHSKPQANGGSHHGNNLFAACISCNTSKGARSTRSVRARHGRTRAPLSAKAETEARQENALLGGGAGAMIGAALFGPPGAILGAIAGLFFGDSIDPEGEPQRA